MVLSLQDSWGSFSAASTWTIFLTSSFFHGTVFQASFHGPLVLCLWVIVSKAFQGKSPECFSKREHITFTFILMFPIHKCVYKICCLLLNILAFIFFISFILHRSRLSNAIKIIIFLLCLKCHTFQNNINSVKLTWILQQLRFTWPFSSLSLSLNINAYILYIIHIIYYTYTLFTSHTHTYSHI